MDIVAIQSVDCWVSQKIPHSMLRPDFRTPPSFFLILMVSVLATGIRQSRGFKSVGFRYTINIH